MTDKTPKHKPTLVERHAMGRLQKVETEKQRPYKKRKEGFHLSRFIIGLVFLIVALVLIMGIIR